VLRDHDGNRRGHGKPWQLIRKHINLPAQRPDSSLAPNHRRVWRSDYGKARYCSTPPPANTLISDAPPGAAAAGKPGQTDLGAVASIAITAYFGFCAGFGTAFGASLTTIRRNSVMSSIAYFTPSRPSPESLTPP